MVVVESRKWCEKSTEEGHSLSLKRRELARDCEQEEAKMVGGRGRMRIRGGGGEGGKRDCEGGGGFVTLSSAAARCSGGGGGGGGSGRKWSIGSCSLPIAFLLLIALQMTAVEGKILERTSEVAYFIRPRMASWRSQKLSVEL